MTPLQLATRTDRSIAFLHDVVGYGVLPGEISDVESLSGLSVDQRALVLAWYWPQRGFDHGFDPFAEFRAASQRDLAQADLHLQVRSLVGSRVLWFLAMGGIAAGRPIDEVLGAVCWRATCSGDALLEVVEGARGLDFRQILEVAEALGLRYVDPLDDDTSVSSWATAASEMREQVADRVRAIVEFTLGVASREFAKRISRIGDDKGARDALLRRFEWFLPDLSGAIFGMTDSALVGSARAAFEDRERLADRSRIGEIVADLPVGSHAEVRGQNAELLGSLMEGIDSNQAHLVAEGFESAARRIEQLPLEGASIGQGYGWLLMDRLELGGRIDSALAALDSIAEARGTIRKVFGTGERRSTGRPGDVYVAPAPATRYRALYEALATTADPQPILTIDPIEHRIHTTTRGWIDLPSSAVRDLGWWSGSGQSSTGRPQVRAWRAAGYDTPTLLTNDDGLVVFAQFPALPGRDEWLRANEEAERLRRGQFTVPAPSNTPLHAVDSYGGPPVWRMDDEQLAALRLSVTRPAIPTAADRPEPEKLTHASKPSSDADRIARLVDYLREQGESDRREIESLFTSHEASLSADLDVAKWLPNLLTKASRKGQIANIGSRSQPRWVAAGTPAHLAARLTRVLEHDKNGERTSKRAIPKLAPGDPVPADLYQDVIRHAFPTATPEPLPPGATPTHTEPNGAAILTEAGINAVLAGRQLTETGIEALLTTIYLKKEADWDATTAAAGTADQIPGGLKLDENAIFADRE